MILNIIWKEIKYQLKNVTFYGFFIVVLLMFFSQLGIPTMNDLAITTQSEKYYHTEKITDHDKQMKHMYLWLSKNYSEGTVLKYKFSFGYYATLTDIQKNYLKTALDKIYTFDDKNNLQVNVSYDEFLGILKALNKNLGSNTIYDAPEEHGIFNDEISLESAEKTFNDVMKNDKFTNAYGRIFADYLGITAGFFPVFISAFIFIREKRNKEYEKIYSSKISFTKYILAKYIGICICIIGCYLILATYTTLAYFKFALDSNCVIDTLAIYKYTFGWIGPTVLFTTAFGILISAIFNNAIAAIAFQLVLCFTSIHNLIGQYGLTKYIVRFNVFGEHNEYVNFKPAILENRVFYTAFSFAIVLFSSYIWTKFRKNT